MNRSKKYNCLVYMNRKHSDGTVLIWSGDKSAAQMASQYDIPTGMIFSTGKITFDTKKQAWQVSLEPMLTSGCRLEKDEQLVLAYIEQTEQKERAAQLLKQQKESRS